MKLITYLQGWPIAEHGTKESQENGLSRHDQQASPTQTYNNNDDECTNKNNIDKRRKRIQREEI